MRAVVQRVKNSKVTVQDRLIAQIGTGITVLIGISDSDTDSDVLYLLDKIINLRIFEDQNGKMNLSVKDIGGGILAVSQFTLYGDVRKGKRPSFSQAAEYQTAEGLYNLFVSKAKETGIDVQTGIYGADMCVEIHNDGPVTILIDSEKKF